MSITRLLAIAVLILGLSGCGSAAKDDSATAEDPDKVQVVATYSILGDMIAEIGGDHVQVHSIVPLGVDPHEYTPLPLDLQKSAQADLILWNGLNLEMGDGWFASLLDISGKEFDTDQVVEAAAQVTPKYLADSAGESTVNPHAFLDPNVGIQYVEAMRDGLIKIDPDNAGQYEQNAADYISELEEIDQLYKDNIAQIPSAQRVLVTSENAYQYMADRYGLTTGFVWEIDTDEQGTPEQIKELIHLIKTTKVPALFVESNKDPRPMETISRETGVPIYGTLFSDELGKPGQDGGTYLKMLRFNIKQIHGGLTQ